MNSHYIGVDLGGTKILTAIADKEGELISRSKLPTEADRGTGVIIENINRSINHALEQAGLDHRSIIRIGVGSPGPLSTGEGIIYENSNLPWKNVPIVDLLEEKTGIPVKLENDANAAAMGEKWFGAGRGIDNLIYVTISTGIGAGIIIERQVYHGINDGAGEVGHMTLEPEGPVCGCGNHGCFEALASGTAIGRMGREAVEEGQQTLIRELSDKNPDKIEAPLIARAARKGDAVARSIYQKAGYYLGIGLGNLVNLFNPEMIVLGGGVMKARELFMDDLLASLEERALTPSLSVLEVREVELGDDTGVMGAIAVAMEDRLIS